MVNYMEDMNVHEVVYNDKVFIIKVIGKLSKTKLTILNVIMNISNRSINLGNFYAKLPKLVDTDYMNIFIKNLIDNIDEVIFKNNRYIGKTRTKLDINYKDKILGEIYNEFLNKEKNSYDYIKYSYFLELYFNGHSIPDSIKREFLAKKNKSILDFIDLEEEIKSEFCGSIGLLKLERDYEYNLEKLDKLNNELELKEKEINLLIPMIEKVNKVIETICENDKNSGLIDELEIKLKNTSIFDKSRKEIKSSLKNLVNYIVPVDIEYEKKELFTMYSYYTSMYEDSRGLFVIFDNLSLEDISNVLNDIYKTKKISYDKLAKKRDVLKKKISSYDEESIDISDLYDRLESK